MNRSSAKTNAVFLLFFLFAVVSLAFPKMVLFLYYNGTLWGNYHLPDYLLVSAQDVLLASSGVGGLLWGIAEGRMKGRAVLAVAVSMVLFVLLMLDARVRQLWLQPTDWALLKYLFAGLSDLESGNEFFFKTQAGFGMTFRRLLVVSGFVCTLSWSLILALGYFHFRAAAAPGAVRKLSRTFVLWVVLPCGTVALLASVKAPRYDYALQQNIFTAPLVHGLRSVAGLDVPPDLSKGELFEKKTKSAAKSFQDTPRRLFKDTPPFSNVIIVAFETLRWKDMGFENRDSTVAPFLAELSRDGTLAKCYVTMPHSCKSEFSMLTGRHPYPGVEIREGAVPRHESLFWAFRKHTASNNAYCFSSMFLSFENLGGILRACGAEHVFQSKQFMKADSQPTIGSSFGGDDHLLVDGPPRVLQRPFAALYLPLAAHYPYDYPGKPKGQPADFSAYLQSVQYADAILRSVFQGLQKQGLLENTLVVVLGDHGESFSEHGSRVHNNSMYDEEITTPLILWSADHRLKASGPVPVCSEADVAPTILDLLGIFDSDLPIQGNSLLRKPDRDPIYVSSFFQDVSMALIVDNRKYMYFPSSKKLLLFDLESDPDEKSPILLSAQHGLKTSEILTKFQAFDAYQRSQFPAAAR